MAAFAAYKVKFQALNPVLSNDTHSVVLRTNDQYQGSATASSTAPETGPLTISNDISGVGLDIQMTT
jgi:hypothetical protein